MNWEAAGAIGEIVGAVAVVATLGYLAVQTRHARQATETNTIAIKSSANQAKLNYGRQSAELLITDPELREIVLRAEGDPGALNASEQLVFHEFTVWRLAAWEHAYLEYKAGIIDEELWVGWDSVYRHVVENKPGYVAFFRQTQPQWDARFLTHLEKIVNIAGADQPADTESSCK